MGGRGAASGAGGKAANVSWAEAQAMKRQMGQTGDEGAGFVLTSKSWNINAFLRGETNFNTRSGWGLSEQEIRNTTARMDASMKPLPKSIQTVHFVDAQFLSSLGLSPRIGNKTAGAVRGFIRKGDAFTTPAFTSVSTDVNKNVFTGRAIKLNITAKKGTKAIITNNALESEIVLGRNQSWKLTGVKQTGGRLEIDITISR